MAANITKSIPIAQTRSSGGSYVNYQLPMPTLAEPPCISGDVLSMTVDEADVDWSYCGREIIRARPYAEPKAVGAGHLPAWRRVTSAAA